MIPKFSIRQLLWGMVAIGLLSLCMSSAARGSRVAFGISVAVVGAFVPLLAYAVVHWASFAVANFMRLIGRSPEKTDGKPPVIAGVPADPGLQSGLADLEQEVVSDSSEGANDV